MKDKIILDFIKNNPLASSKDIHLGLQESFSYATIKRILKRLYDESLIVTVGKGRSTKYTLSLTYSFFYSIDKNAYFKNEQDHRAVKNVFDFAVMDALASVNLFTPDEDKYLYSLHEKFLSNVAKLSPSAYQKELERLAIDLSWKSSQIEGNTYSLLETERLLKEKETASGKPKDDATMLLNHKEALNFIIEHPDYVVPLSIKSIEDIHSILIKGLDVDRNIRQSRVGISGTNYVPLDNEYQIREALTAMCNLINGKENPLEKSLLSLLLLSYIQGFVDGNKRTARIVSNAILIAAGYCPISFRTVDSIEYKEAMLIFYEQNNISAFKDIFISQFDFAVKTYF